MLDLHPSLKTHIYHMYIYIYTVYTLEIKRCPVDVCTPNETGQVPWDEGLKNSTWMTGHNRPMTSGRNRVGVCYIPTHWCLFDLVFCQFILIPHQTNMLSYQSIDLFIYLFDIALKSLPPAFSSGVIF